MNFGKIEIFYRKSCDYRWFSFIPNFDSFHINLYNDSIKHFFYRSNERQSVINNTRKSQFKQRLWVRKGHRYTIRRFWKMTDDRSFCFWKKKCFAPHSTSFRFFSARDLVVSICMTTRYLLLRSLICGMLVSCHILFYRFIYGWPGMRLL